MSKLEDQNLSVLKAFAFRAFKNIKISDYSSKTKLLALLKGEKEPTLKIRDIGQAKLVELNEQQEKLLLDVMRDLKIDAKENPVGLSPKALEKAIKAEGVKLFTIKGDFNHRTEVASLKEFSLLKEAPKADVKKEEKEAPKADVKKDEKETTKADEKEAPKADVKKDEKEAPKADVKKDEKEAPKVDVKKDEPKAPKPSSLLVEVEEDSKDVKKDSKEKDVKKDSKEKDVKKDSKEKDVKKDSKEKDVKKDSKNEGRKIVLWHINPKQCQYYALKEEDTFSSNANQVKGYGLEAGDILVARASGDHRKRGILGFWQVTKTWHGELEEGQNCWVPPQDELRKAKQSRVKARSLVQINQDNLEEMKTAIASKWNAQFPQIMTQEELTSLVDVIEAL